MGWNYGSGVGNGGQNQGFMFMDLKEDKHRPKVNVIIGQLQQQFMKIPGLMVFLQSPPLITLGQNEGRSQYSVALEDADTAELYKWAPVLEAKLRSIPQLTGHLQRSAFKQSATGCAHRPESGAGVGRESRCDREHALRCLWQPASNDHHGGDGSIRRAPRSAAAVSARSRGTTGSVHPIEPGQNGSAYPR